MSFRFPDWLSITALRQSFLNICSLEFDVLSFLFGCLLRLTKKSMLSVLPVIIIFFVFSNKFSLEDEFFGYFNILPLLHYSLRTWKVYLCICVVNRPAQHILEREKYFRSTFKNRPLYVEFGNKTFRDWC